MALMASMGQTAASNSNALVAGPFGANLAFHDVLANNESSVHELGDPVSKALAQELTQKLRGSAAVDWQRRERVRARLRNLLRITLRRYKCPPDLQEEAIRLILDQAERLADDCQT
jgi:type I restriction enzyme R subunit